MTRYALLSLLGLIGLLQIGIGQAELVRLPTAQIQTYLSGAKVSGNQDGVSWEQSFTVDGVTSYSENNGMRPSSGLWKAENDQYCSQWPPSSNWDCYYFAAEGEELEFIPIHGGASWAATRQR